MLATNGKYYGTTSAGGANDLGTVFELTPTGSLKTLHSFGGADGAAPSALVSGAEGVFYGTTTAGGASNQGVLFKITETGSFKILHSFQGSDGGAPNSLLVAENGSIYGTTTAGGVSRDGTIFALGRNSELRVLHRFSGADAAQPSGPLIEASDNQLYGVTSRRWIEFTSGDLSPCHAGRCGLSIERSVLNGRQKSAAGVLACRRKPNDR